MYLSSFYYVFKCFLNFYIFVFKLINKLFVYYVDQSSIILVMLYSCSCSWCSWCYQIKIEKKEKKRKERKHQIEFLCGNLRNTLERNEVTWDSQ